MDTLSERLKRVRETVLGISQAVMAARLEAEGGLDGTTSVSVMRYEKGERMPGADYVRAVAAISGVPAGWILTGEGSAVAGAGELEQWLETVEQTVRFAGGSQNLTPDERREIQRDVLTGMVRLGRAEGTDVGRLEAMLRELGPAPAPTEARISIADVYQLYKEDLAVARERAAGMRELAIAARIAEEEGVRRNERLERMEQAAKHPQPALPTRELMDIDAAQSAGSVALPAEEAGGQRGTG